eukprot:m.20861 g.20861  ORF g.20861 m.20861 type:complete len:735 (+) comp3835_c0_seq1:71-2275(+)
MSSQDWFRHSITPRDPYLRHRPDVGGMSVSTREMAVGARGLQGAAYSREHATGKLCEMNTGMPPRPYQDNDHRRHGFYNNPDWKDGRHPPQVRPDPGTAFHKHHIMEQSVLEKPPRAKPGETAGVFAGELRPSAYKGAGQDPKDGSVNERQYYPSKNAEWKTRAEMYKDYRPDMDRVQEFRHMMKLDEQYAAARKQAEADQKIADRALIKQFPFGKNPVGLKEDLKRYYGIEGHAEPLEALHVTDARPLKTIAGFTHAHESKLGVRKHVEDVETGARYENRPDMIQERRNKQAEASAMLQSQVEDNRARRAMVIEAEQRALEADQGLVSRLERSTPNKPHKPVERHRITEPPKPACDKRLADNLRKQIQWEEQRKEYEKHPNRYDKFQKFDPFSEPFATQKIQDARRHKRVDVPAVVDGSSLANVMGTKGGGAPVSPTLRPDGGEMYPKSKILVCEEPLAEAKAQAAGQSEFGRPGAGAAIRRPNGEIDTEIYGRVTAIQTGRVFDRETQAYKDKYERHRADGRQSIKDHEARRAQERAEARQMDAHTSTSLPLTPSPCPQTGRRHRTRQEERIGLLVDKTIEHDPALKASLDEQVQERQRQRAQERAHAANGGKSFADNLTPYRATPRGRPFPSECNQEEFLKRPVLLADPEDIHRTRRELKREMSMHRRHRKELHKRKLREEMAHVQHGSLPGNVDRNAGKPLKDNEGNIRAHRKRLPNEILAHTGAAPTLV